MSGFYMKCKTEVNGNYNTIITKTVCLNIEAKNQPHEVNVH